MQKKYDIGEESEKSNIQLHTSVFWIEDYTVFPNRLSLTQGPLIIPSATRRNLYEKLDHTLAFLNARLGIFPSQGSVPFAWKHRKLLWPSTKYFISLSSLSTFSHWLSLSRKNFDTTFDNVIQNLKLSSTILGNLFRNQNTLTSNDFGACFKLLCIVNAKSFKYHPNWQGRSLRSRYLPYEKIRHLKTKADVDTNYPCDVCDAAKSTRNVSCRTFKEPQCHLYELMHSDKC